MPRTADADRGRARSLAGRPADANGVRAIRTVPCGTISGRKPERPSRRWGLGQTRTTELSQSRKMANHEDDNQAPITREEISAAYGDLKPSQEHSSLGREQIENALHAAMQDINRCTVAITTMFEQEETDNSSLEELRPATGVLVEAKGVHGIVTAGHVLGGEDRTRRYDKGRCTIGVMALQDPRRQTTQQPYFRVRNRLCIAYGVKNKKANGPDIAYIPITPREWALLELDGVKAWTALEEPNPEMPRNTKEAVLFDCCVGPNFKASQELQDKHPESSPRDRIPGIANRGARKGTDRSRHVGLHETHTCGGRQGRVARELP